MALEVLLPVVVKRRYVEMNLVLTLSDLSFVRRCYVLEVAHLLLDCVREGPVEQFSLVQLRMNSTLHVVVESVKL